MLYVSRISTVIGTGAVTLWLRSVSAAMARLSQLSTAGLHSPIRVGMPNASVSASSGSAGSCTSHEYARTAA